MHRYATYHYQDVTLFDAAGTVLRVSAAEGADVLAVEEDVAELIDDTQEVYRRRHTLRLRTWDGEAIAQVRAWQEARTPVRAVAAGERGLQWYEAVMPRLERPGLQLLGPHALDVVLTTRKLAPAIYERANLLGYAGWEDDGNGVPAGYAFGNKVDLFGCSFSGSTWTMQTDVSSGGDASVYHDAPLPLASGTPMTLLWPVAAPYSGASSGLILWARYLDAAGSVIGENSDSFAGTIGTKSLTMEVPAGTYEIRCELQVDVPTTSGTIQLQAPTLAAGSASSLLSY